MQSLSERNISFSQLRETLSELEARKVDIVRLATDLHVTGKGLIEVTEQIPGSTDTLTRAFEPNDVFIEQVANALKIGIPFARRMFAERPDVAADMVNGLWHGRSPDGFSAGYPADARSFLFRGYAEADGAAPTARALLSSKYRVMDNYDVLTAALEGMSGVPGLEGKVTSRRRTCPTATCSSTSWHPRLPCPRRRYWSSTVPRSTPRASPGPACSRTLTGSPT